MEESGDGFRVTFYRKVVSADWNTGSDVLAGTAPRKVREAGKRYSIDRSAGCDIESDTETRNSDTENRESNTEGDIENQKGGMASSKTWIRKIMKKMQQEGTLRREGSTKKGIWIVKEKKA